MIRKSLILLAIILILLLPGCPEVNDTSFSYDPDPVDDSITLPDPAEDLYIIANIYNGDNLGKIVAFWSSNPLEYVTLAEDASTEEYFSKIRISQDLKYLLYTRVNNTRKDLVLLNIVTSVKTVIAENIASNESEFIDNNSFHFSLDGDIRKFNILTMADPPRLVHISELNCNHGGQVSPDGNKLVFKDQDPNQHEKATIAWSDIHEIPATSYISVDCYEDEIYLPESFFFNWRDNNRVLFKPNPGLSYKLSQYQLEVEFQEEKLTTARLSLEGENVYFKGIVISPDKKNLLIYGYNGLYLLNLLNLDVIAGDLEPKKIYSSSNVTKYAAFGSESKSFVVGTSNWMGIYNTEGLQKTNASISNILGDYGTLYALHCR